MRNHWHLFLTTPEPNLSRGMHDVNAGYATLYNRRHRRSLALLQGPFKASLVQEEGYDWTLGRYVHLNPVRAGAVERPDQYRWSSYRHFLDLRDAPSWLGWQTVLHDIDGNTAQNWRQYISFVEWALTTPIESPLAPVVGGVLLGSDAWVNHLKRRLEGRPPQRGVPARRWLAVRPRLE